jgi:eukaryotic-like serine/threonine-protein kinase
MVFLTLMSLQEKRLYKFGPFYLDAREHVLLRDGEVVPVAPKAVDLLVALVENSGRVLKKDDLMNAVWPDSFVEEANLSRHIFVLRKVLGEDKNGAKYIETIPRRGYRFMAVVTEVQNEGAELLVQERARTRIVIEEETDSSDEPSIEIPALEHPQPVEQKQFESLAATATQVSPIKTRRAVLALLIVALLVAGGAAIFSWRTFFRGSKTPAPTWKTKITRLTSDGKVGVAISPDGKFISYWQNYTDGAGTLWLRQTATNKEIQLIEPSERIIGGSAFSPDMEFIYYVVYDKHDPKGALYRVPVLGGPPARLLGDFSSKFTLSPDGRQVAFYRFSPDVKQRSIVIAALDGSSEQALLTIDLSEKPFSGHPVWSPDGRIIAFAAMTDPDRRGVDGHVSFFAIDIDSRDVKSLTNELWTEVGKTAWSSDGQTMFFVAARPRIGNQLYYLNYADGEVRRITPDLQSYGNYGLGITADGNTLVADLWESEAQLWTVAADGRASTANRLTSGISDGAVGITSLSGGCTVYVSRTGDDYDLWEIKEDGSGVKPLTSDSFYEGDVTATSDGRYLVFTSNRAGGTHIFRMDADGSDVKQLTYGNGSEHTPDCSPDGEWVVYTSWSGNTSTIWKVPIAGGTPVQLTDYHSIAPSFSPDGKLISCILRNNILVDKGSLAVLSSDGGQPIFLFQVVSFSWNYATPRWTPDGQAVVYADKQKGAGNLWRQPLAGGPPEQLTNFKNDTIFNFAYSRDARNIILARGQKGGNAVLIRDFK